MDLRDNMNTLGLGALIQQRPLDQKLVFPSDTTAHPTQPHCAPRTIGSQLCFPPICKLVRVSPNPQFPEFTSGLAVFRHTKSSLYMTHQVNMSDTQTWSNCIHTQTNQHLFPSQE